MSTPTAAFLLPLVGYLSGSILPAHILARRRGLDFRVIGKNPGTAETFRHFGFWPAVLVYVLDATKALLPLIAGDLLRGPGGQGPGHRLRRVALPAAVEFQHRADSRAAGLAAHRMGPGQRRGRLSHHHRADLAARDGLDLPPRRHPPAAGHPGAGAAGGRAP